MQRCSSTLRHTPVAFSTRRTSGCHRLHHDGDNLRNPTQSTKIDFAAVDGYHFLQCQFREREELNRFCFLARPPAPSPWPSLPNRSRQLSRRWNVKGANDSGERGARMASGPRTITSLFPSSFDFYCSTSSIHFFSSIFLSSLHRFWSSLNCALRVPFSSTRSTKGPGNLPA